MDSQPKSNTRLIAAVKRVCRLCILVLSILMTVVLLHGLKARTMPELKPWHRVTLSEEFTRRLDTSDMTFEAYQQLEDRLFKELDQKVTSKTVPAKKEQYNRYHAGSLSSPNRFTQNWNRSYELVPDDIEGGILLIHGLTDSPYSMRSLAETFYAANYYVLCLRMPGHGTVPAALTDISWKDWLSAARVGFRHVRAKVGDSNPLLLAGYSNGGAVSLLYTLESLQAEDMATPDRVILLSPAIGITEFARAAYWLKLASVLPGFEKAKWDKVFPEYDPFKYNSFPLNAATQSYALAKVVQKRINRMQADGSLSKLPAVITFQSVVDSTVIAKHILAKFYDKLSPGGHQVIGFGTNQNVFIENFLKTAAVDSLTTHRVNDKLPYTLTLITNSHRESQEVIARTKEAGQTQWYDTPLNASWPGGIYSLSHVALPFPMDDSLYGLKPATDPNDHVQLGQVYARGEKNALRIPEANLMRLRCNPFWDYLQARINAVIEDCRGDFKR